jgi:hypothetical protein
MKVRSKEHQKMIMEYMIATAKNNVDFSTSIE